MPLRLLTWNLLHGRSVPPAGRDLFDGFARALGGWEWDVALLQEVPPWWPALLGERLQADQRRVLTSRNALLPFRRAVAVRWPDLIRSNGGGANAILVRTDVIAEHRWRRLSILPERRWVHAVRLRHADLWVANLHASAHNTARALHDGRVAAATARRWASHRPVVLGGDFNLRELTLEGFLHAAGHDVDHVFVRGLQPLPSTAQTLDRDRLDRGRLDPARLSDHVPVAVTIAPAPARGPSERPSP